jgi:hypothetical protein
MARLGTLDLGPLEPSVHGLEKIVCQFHAIPDFSEASLKFAFYQIRFTFPANNAVVKRKHQRLRREQQGSSGYIMDHEVSFESLELTNEVAIV